MRTLAFDGRTGASGDMILGALLDLGANPEVLAPVEDALPVTYRVRTVDEVGIAATAVDVLLDGTDRCDGDGEDGHDHHGDGHSHADHDHADHDHDDHVDHDHHDHHHPTPAEGHGPHRSYREVIEIVEEMGLSETVESNARATFELLGEAEAAVHGTDLDSVHFHEVGADDAIADVVGAALLFDDLDADRVVTTPISGGGGELSMAHGTYPIPPPAVVELATRADWSLAGGPVDVELLTPTGAAILGHYADGVDRLPPMTVEATGYGAGDRDLDDRPNVLRATVGETEGTLRREGISVLETNLDDATPETLGALQETLVDAGARDVTILPATMKKSRPGHLVKVIARPADAERVAHQLAVETGTLGVREIPSAHRWVANRRIETVAFEVDGRSFEVDVKVATDDEGDVIDVSAEHDDALAVARETETAVREIRRLAEETWRS